MLAFNDVVLMTVLTDEEGYCENHSENFFRHVAEKVAFEKIMGSG
jgi:hypothetical protein